MAVFDINGNTLQGIYNLGGSALTDGYDIDGNTVYVGEPLPLDYSNYTTTDLFTYVQNGFNGFDVHNGVIVQFLADDKVFLFNLSNHTKIIEMSCVSGHGDSATFSNEFYDANDEFPLIYVSADTPNEVYVNRITRSSSTLIRTLSFPSSVGYYSSSAFDFDNNICYVVAYKKANYTSSDGGTNKTVVSKWDLSNLTDNGDGTYTPTFISQYERDFIYVMQGLQYFDGYIWVSSGYNDGGSQYVYAMNPTTGVIDHTITLDDTIEIEGLAWIYNGIQNKYWMLVGQQNGWNGYYYSKIDFETLNP